MDERPRICAPGGIQTHDLQNRNLTFYSAELRGLGFKKARQKYMKFRNFS